MIVIDPSDDRTIETAAVAMFGLAAPSQGSKQVATWKVSLSCIGSD
jgi:hypothetical protein